MPRRSQSFWGTEIELHRPIQLHPLCKTDFISQTHPSVKGIQKAFDIFEIYVDTSPCSQDNDTPKLQGRDVYDLVHTVDDMITRRFQMIGFIYWALYSIGFGTKEIIAFQRLVKNLCNYLYGVISQMGIQKDQLEFLKNPFVKAVIYERDIKDIFAVGTRFIIEPLQRFFYTWNPEALQEIQFLKVRFDRQHLSDTPDTEPFSLFDTDTSFLSSLQANLSHLAITRTRGDLDEFRKIEESQVGERRLVALGNRWDAYSHTVRDCAVLVGEKRLIRLAYRLRFLRNYYSLTALLVGLQNAGISIPVKMSFFIDSNDNYLAYRSHVDFSPALHFLQPLLRIADNNPDARQTIWRFQRYHELLRFRGPLIKLCCL